MSRAHLLAIHPAIQEHRGVTFFVHHSHRTEALVDRLADVLRPPSSPFVQDVVVVHGRGLERWLGMQLADRLGVLANVRFPFPGELVGEITRASLGDHVDLSAWSGERLVWAIRASLHELDGEPALAPIETYVNAGGPEERSRRLQGLSLRIAAIFERLAAYRPELVSLWRAGEGEGWEPPLWRAVAERIPGDDVATAIAALETKLSNSDASSMAGRLALFNVTTLPPLYVRAFKALGRVRDVHVFQLHPSPAWWDKVEKTGVADAAHPLLASMGRLVADMQLTLGGAAVGAASLQTSCSADDGSMLTAIQADIQADAIIPRAFDANDRSIQVHACHGPTRQVQVLRDVLLDLFEADPELHPRDIVVMAPDIETFAPLVDAVFSDGAPWERRHEHAGNLPRIPFRLADRGARALNPVAEALLSLLSLASGRLRASAMLDLLAMEPVRTRFSIDSADLPLVREWVAASGVRWARDAAHRAEENQPASDEYTWRFGLSRMLIGQAALDGDEPVLSVSPFGEVEGRHERALLGSVVDFAESVFEVLDELVGETTREKTVDEWARVLSVAVDTLFDVAPTEAWQAIRVRDGLTKMADAASEASFQNVVDLPSIIASLEGRFGAREPGAGYLSGAVTFCQLVPMRSVPFKVVCLIGMDDGEFPRIGARPGFDRMAKERLPGDRSARDDDRALFLEAILSARSTLVITTTARGVKDDRPRPPAVPVCELLDVIDATYGEHEGRRVSEHLTTQHPLLPFSERAFNGRYGFDTRMRDAAEASREGLRAPQARAPFLPTALPAAPAELEVDVRTLCRFWQHPMQFLCQRRLGIWLREDEDPVKDREPLELGGLEAWALRDRLIAWALDGEIDIETDEALSRARGEARLPLGTPGDVLYKRAAQQANEIAESVRALRSATSGPSAPRSIDFEAAGVHLTGAVGHLFGDTRLTCQAGTVRSKAELAVWIQHLALAAMGTSATTHLVGYRSEVRFSPIEPDAARVELTQLLELYRAGLASPLPFFPHTSRAFYEGLIAKDEWEGNKRARRAWDSFSEPGPYGLLVLGDVYPFYPEAVLPIETPHSVEMLARTVWAPALQYCEAT